MSTLLISALLLDSLSLPIAPAFADETRHGRRTHKHRHGEPPSEPDPVVASPPASPASPASPATPATIMIAPSPAVPSGGPASGVPPFALPAVPQTANAEHSPFVARSPHATPYKTLGIAGLGIVGSTFVLSMLLGGISYGAFAEGQWGWFVPLVGPSLVMSGVCGSPGSSCYFKSLFTYTMGPLTTAAYLTGITLAIVGAVGYKRGRDVANHLQVLPYASIDSRGLVLAGTF
jgi:hypothetical protein